MARNFLFINKLGLSFLFGVYEGKVALWKDHQKDPIKVLPYQVSMLPQADQKALEKGIHIESLSQLHKMLEDYLS